MQDGIGQVGAGQDDMRLAGEDLQHNRQKRSGNRAPHDTPVSQIEVHEALMNEMRAHKEGKAMRVSDLERHYKR
jgi:hypothetical protein